MLKKGMQFRAHNDDGLVTDWVVIHQSDSASYIMALPASSNPEMLARAMDKDAEFALTPDDDIPTFFNYREVVAVRVKSDEAWQEEWEEMVELQVIDHKAHKVYTIPTGPVK